MDLKRFIAVLCALMIAICQAVPMVSFAEAGADDADEGQQSVTAADLALKRADITARSGGKTLKLTGRKWIMLAGRTTGLCISAESAESVQSVAWSSSNSKIARVSSAGKVTARAKGTAVITAYVKGKDGKTIRKTVKIKVIAKTVRKTKKYKGVSKWKTAVSNIGKRYDTKPQGCVLFYGNSSIRRWKTLSRDMPGMSVLNHGFGGSAVNDCLYYADKLVIPYNPRAIVLYAGTNDIGFGYSVKEVYSRTKDFFDYIHCRLPDTQIYYISMPLQPKRIKRWSSIKALNKKIKQYCKDDPRVTYINASAVLNKGNLSKRSKYFLKDGIHLTKKGYIAWTSAIRPVLLRDGYAD